jgi:hypothetical protein
LTCFGTGTRNVIFPPALFVVALPPPPADVVAFPPPAAAAAEEEVADVDALRRLDPVAMVDTLPASPSASDPLPPSPAVDERDDDERLPLPDFRKPFLLAGACAAGDGADAAVSPAVLQLVALLRPESSVDVGGVVVAVDEDFFLPADFVFLPLPLPTLPLEEWLLSSPPPFDDDFFFFLSSPPPPPPSSTSVDFFLPRPNMLDNIMFTSITFDGYLHFARLIGGRDPVPHRIVSLVSYLSDWDRLFDARGINGTMMHTSSTRWYNTLTLSNSVAPFLIA